MTQARYSTVAIILHWLIAALLVWIVLLGWEASDVQGSAKIAPLQLHKPLGITVLLLTLARLGWRLTHRPPAISPHLKPWERRLARVVHWGFYVILLALPLSGWAMVSASKLITVFPIDMFGLFNWPALSFLTNLPALAASPAFSSPTAADILRDFSAPTALEAADGNWESASSVHPGCSDPGRPHGRLQHASLALPLPGLHTPKAP